jgi:predicted nucleic acid-binding Zn ribbon protein
MRKIEALGGKVFYFRCEICGHETEEVKKTKHNIDEQPPTSCPNCGCKVRNL